MPVMRPGMTVRLPHLGDATGKIIDTGAFDGVTIRVDLGEGGSWTGLAAMAKVVIPPDTRHPAVKAAMAAATDSAILRMLEDPAALTASGVAAAFRWAAEHPPETPLVDRFAGAGWLLSLADEIEASVTNDR